MSLSLINTGGYYSAIPSSPLAFSDTADLSVLLRVRRGTNSNTDSLFRLVNSARTRGISVVTGGGTATGGANTDLFAVCGSGATSAWGSSANHNGRGLATAGSMSSTGFDTFVFIVRGSAAADNTGTSGAQQFEAVYKNGVAATVGAGAGAVAVGNTGNRLNYGHRDGTTASYFTGNVADICVWQGYRLTATDLTNLFTNNVDPSTIANGNILFLRSFRSSTTAEIGNVTLTAAGTAPTLDSSSANNPAPWVKIGEISQSIGEITVTATGSGLPSGSIAQSIGEITVTSAGARLLLGDVATSIGEISVTAGGVLPIFGNLSSSIGEIAFSATSATSNAGFISQSIGQISSSATGELKISGAVSQSIGEITVTATSSLPVAGVISQSIGEITVTSTGGSVATAIIAQSIGEITATIAGIAPVKVMEPNQDAEIVNHLNSTITSTGENSYTVRLAPDDQPDISAGWVNIIARVQVAAGKTVRLEADLSGHQYGLNDGVNNGWCYYDVTASGHTYATKAKWATNRQFTGDFGFIRGDLPTSGTDRTYLVALQPVWKEQFDGDWMAELRTRTHVHEAASVAAARVADPTLPANAHARVAPGTRTQVNSVPTADAYMRAVRITDTGAAPLGGKRQAVLIMGQHASEHQGNYAAREFTDWLTTVNTGAAELLRLRLLKNFDWHLYNGNPLGRRYGKERWTEEQAGDEDPNRAWDDSGSSQINAARSAIGVDAPAFALLFDFHGTASRDTATWNDAFMLYPNDAGGPSDPTPFFSRLEAKLGAFQTSSSNSTSEFAQGWAYDNGAKVAETLEYVLGGPGYLDPSGEVRITYEIPNGYIREVVDEMWLDGLFGRFAESSLSIGQIAATITGSNSQGGNVAVSIGEIVFSSTGNLPIKAQGNVSIDDFQPSIAGSLPIKAQGNVSIGEIAVAITTSSTQNGNIAVLIGDVIFSSAGKLPILAQTDPNIAAFLIECYGTSEAAVLATPDNRKAAVTGQSRISSSPRAKRAAVSSGGTRRAPA